RRGTRIREFHPRKWVDGSRAAYKERHSNSRMSPTEVGGWFKGSLQGEALQLANVTHGSGWMVQGQPTRRGTPTRESHARKWVDGSISAYKERHSNSRIPRTEVGGWFNFSLQGEA